MICKKMSILSFVYDLWTITSTKKTSLEALEANTTVFLKILVEMFSQNNTYRSGFAMLKSPITQ